MIHTRMLCFSVVLLVLAGCGGGGGEPATPETTTAPLAEDTPAGGGDVAATALDEELLALIVAEELTGNPAAGRNLPAVTTARATLGKFLFYTTNLGGENDAACVTCHHPVLGGGDDLSLSIGVTAVNSVDVADPDLLGPGRHSVTAGSFPLVPRNAPTTFNSGLWDAGMFWDSRVTSLSDTPLANGQGDPIATPDSAAFNSADATLPANVSLPAAQARFPVTSNDEMRGTFAAGDDNQTLRSTLATRFDDPLGAWATLFTEAYGDPAISFDRIADAIGEFERSQVFVSSPWSAYVGGDLNAIGDDAKAGAVLFFTAVNDGGAGCSRCHSGDTFSDSRHHLVAFPQVSDDLGRAAINGQDQDRYHFRTPSLLNVAVTAPYGHAGLYQTLTEVVAHYDNPRGNIDDLFGEQGDVPFQDLNPPVCQLPQVSRMVAASGSSCETLLTDAWNNSQTALDNLNDDDVRNPLGPRPNLNNQEVAELVAFLEALTDPCTEDRDCLDPWIVDNDDFGVFPDDSALIGHDEAGLNF